MTTNETNYRFEELENLQEEDYEDLKASPVFCDLCKKEKADHQIYRGDLSDPEDESISICETCLSLGCFESPEELREFMFNVEIRWEMNQDNISQFVTNSTERAVGESEEKQEVFPVRERIAKLVRNQLQNEGGEE